MSRAWKMYELYETGKQVCSELYHKCVSILTYRQGSHEDLGSSDSILWKDLKHSWSATIQ